MGRLIFSPLSIQDIKDMDVLMERLVILDKIQTGIEQADRGELIPIEEIIKEMKEWDVE